MGENIYRLGMVSLIVMTALAMKFLPLPWQGGAGGWFSLFWYLAALAAFLGYWYKLDLAKARRQQHKMLQELRAKKAGRARQRAY